MIEMDADLNAVLNNSFDSLEKAFSDSSRKVVRQIKAEWQRILKYRNNIAAKEDELLAAKEKLMHLNEIKSYNDKYLQATKTRIEDLKQSNIQLKSKLSHLSKEDERIAKKITKQEEYMSKQLSFYEEKWRKRYETYYSKNPAFQEKERALGELQEVKQKLQDLEEEFRKCKKDLFQAKCERNKRAIEESKFYPFQNFAISIAKIYLETKNEHVVCKKISEEIAIMERNIEAQKSKIRMQYLKEKDTIKLRTAKHVRFETNEYDGDTQMLHQAFVRSDTRTVFNVTDGPSKQCLSPANQNDNVLLQQGYDCHKNSTSLQDESMRTNRKIYQNDIDINAGKINNPALQFVWKNKSSKIEIPTQKETKALKWMERLEIFVPKFSSSPTVETDNESIEEVPSTSFGSKNIEAMNIEPPNKTQNKSSYDIVVDRTDVIRREDTFHLKNINKSSSIFTNNLHQRTLSPLQKNPEIDANLICMNDTTVQQSSINKVSKYFNTYDSNSVMKKYENTAVENATITKSCIQNNMEQNTCYETMDVDEEIIINKQNPLVQRYMTSRLNAEIKPMECETDELFNKQNTDNIFHAELMPQTSTKFVELHQKHDVFPSESNKIQNREDNSFNKKRKTDNIVHTDINRTKNMEDSFNINKQIEIEITSEDNTARKRITVPFSEKQKIDNELHEENIHNEITLEEISVSAQGFNTEVETVMDISLTDESISKPVSAASMLNENEDTKSDSYEERFNNLKVNEVASVKETKNQENEVLSEKEILDTPSVSKPETTELEIPNEANQHSLQLQNISPSALLKQDNKQMEENLKNNITTNSDVADNHNNTSNNSQKEILSSAKSSSSVNLDPPSENCSLKSMESDPKTPLAKSIKGSAESEMKISPSVPFKIENVESPGFVYTIRPMFQTNVLTDMKESQDFTKDIKNNLFTPFAFFNNPKDPKSPLMESTKSDNNNEFLASAYEDYLNDSPPMMKGTEKSMFAFGEDSPGTDAGQSDFFPLFAANSEEPSKEKKDGAQFVLNFGNVNETKSPDSNSSFKFLF